MLFTDEERKDNNRTDILLAELNEREDKEEYLEKIKNKINKLELEDL